MGFLECPRWLSMLGFDDLQELLQGSLVPQPPIGAFLSLILLLDAFVSLILSDTYSLPSTGVSCLK